MRLYFNCCCYNRPFDDQAQQRIHDESEAILSLMNRSVVNGDAILDSSVLQLEIDRNWRPCQTGEGAVIAQNCI